MFAIHYATFIGLRWPHPGCFTAGTAIA